MNEAHSVVQQRSSRNGFFDKKATEEFRKQHDAAAASDTDQVPVASGERSRQGQQRHNASVLPGAIDESWFSKPTHHSDAVNLAKKVRRPGKMTRRVRRAVETISTETTFGFGYRKDRLFENEIER